MKEANLIGVTKRSEACCDVGLVERPEPQLAPGIVILKTAGAGICGTDLHIFKNEYKSAPPVVLGHEVCGYVEQTGDGVDPSLVGKRFVAEPFYSTCGRCAYCRSGQPNLCLSRKSIGTHVDGAMAPRVAVPAINLHIPPESMSDAAATLAEPLACVTNCLYGEYPYIEPGDEVLVIGPGTIGLLAAQVARIMGGNVVIRGTERDRQRLDTAEKLGFTISLVGDDLPEDSFDVAIECSGNAHGYAEALQFLSKTGQLIQLGLAGVEFTLPMDLVCYKDLVITSGFGSTPRSWQRALKLMHSGKLDLQILVTATLPLSKWKEAFDRGFALDGIKFVLDPRLDAR